MLYPNRDMLEKPADEIEKALFSCDYNDSAPAIAYVSKMFAVPSDMLPENRRKQLTAEELREKGRIQREARNQREARLRASNGQLEESISETSSTTSSQTNLTSTESLEESADSIKISSLTDENDEITQLAQAKETFIGFARLYSGTIHVGQKLYVLGPKYDPAFPDKYCSEITVEKLYLMMGRELESLQEVPAGNVFGVGGLEGHILKNGTLSSTKRCKSLAGVAMEVGNQVHT
jgi:ribosome assembly protein 1